MSAHRRDWETQRERLSAYLDGQFPEGERSALERHIAGCARCAAELEELRRTIEVLRTLPAPALPRSFALPELAPAATAPRAVRHPVGVARGGRRATPWAGIAQWAGGLAAVAGLVLLLGGAVSGLRAGGESTAAYGGAAPASVPWMHTPQGSSAVDGATATAVANDAQQQQKSPSPTAVSGATMPPEQTPTHAFDREHGASAGGEPPPLGPLAGGGLVLGGGLVFVAGSLAKRRAR